MNQLIESLESLESRTLLSDTITTVGGPTLVVRGTNNSDLITLSVRLASDRTMVLRAIVNSSLKNYDLTGVTSIQVEALNGDDRVFVDENAVRGMLINGGIANDTINAGNGNDTLIGRISISIG